MVLKSNVIPIVQDSPLQPKPDATGELFFTAHALPAVGYKSYYVEEISSSVTTEAVEADENDLTISNDFLTVKLDKGSGYLMSVDLHNRDGTTTSIPLHQEILYYFAMPSGNGQASNPYIFRPNQTDAVGFEEKPQNRFVIVSIVL
jgi:hypothetical protein